MLRRPVYLDNHATTRVDPRVVQAMLPYFDEQYGNASSTSHVFGHAAREAVEAARCTLATALGANPREIVFTSGATESNNLVLRGVAERARRRGNHLVSVATEHKAVLDPLRRLSRKGFEVTLLPVAQAPSPWAGLVDLDQLRGALRRDTLLVSVMLANNEIGILQPLAAIAEICREHDVLLHCDATQGLGRTAVDVNQLGVDLLSCSAHKIYGPKGVGALYVRRAAGRTRLEPQIDGGGQEGGVRSGTLNVPGIVGFGRAVEVALAEMPSETQKIAQLRQRLYDGLVRNVPDLVLNGPTWDQPDKRLAGNLNITFPRVDGEALMMSIAELAVSSGSACTSANPEPSHVLRALGLSEDATRASLRFGIGRFNTTEEIDFAAELVAEHVHRLRQLASPS